MHGSSAVLSSKPQQELASSQHDKNDVTVRPQASDTEQRLFASPKAAQSTGTADASANSQNVASACSIESAIDSVISQARADTDTVPDLPDSLPPELLDAVNAIKDVVC